MINIAKTSKKAFATTTTTSKTRQDKTKVTQDIIHIIDLVSQR